MGNCMRANKKLEMTVEVKPTCPVKCFGDEDQNNCVSSCCNININKARTPKNEKPKKEEPTPKGKEPGVTL